MNTSQYIGTYVIFGYVIRISCRLIEFFRRYESQKYSNDKLLDTYNHVWVRLNAVDRNARSAFYSFDSTGQTETYKNVSSELYLRPNFKGDLIKSIETPPTKFICFFQKKKTKQNKEDIFQVKFFPFPSFTSSLSLPNVNTVY